MATYGWLQFRDMRQSLLKATSIGRLFRIFDQVADAVNSYRRGNVLVLESQQATARQGLLTQRKDAPPACYSMSPGRNASGDRRMKISDSILRSIACSPCTAPRGAACKGCPLAATAGFTPTRSCKARPIRQPNRNMRTLQMRRVRKTPVQSGQADAPQI